MIIKKNSMKCGGNYYTMFGVAEWIDFALPGSQSAKQNPSIPTLHLHVFFFKKDS